MKWSENPQMNPHEGVTKTSRRRGKKKQHSELVPTTVNSVVKTKNGDFPSKSKMNVVFCSRHLKLIPLTERKEKDRSYEKGKEPGLENWKLYSRHQDGCSSKTWWEISNGNTNNNR
ncbi:unnamed protein product [Hymenolepis diminuta]|uniref:Uncharacterized protein n=1 Tax=Hymenolepis diminuta TaxID=6216 RepID=A0A564YK42_HYMDI|nr:unnamed protein product [Hymenolepis diminuta]